MDKIIKYSEHQILVVSRGNPISILLIVAPDLIKVVEISKIIVHYSTRTPEAVKLEFNALEN